MHRPTRPDTRPLTLAARAAFGVLALSLCAGCGPFGYLKKTSKDASRAVTEAEAEGAEELAPYEYWGSKAYLEQSKVMMGYSEYERSFDYGDRSKQLAEEAKAKSERREAGIERETDPDVTAPEKVPDAEQPAPEPAAAPAEPAEEGGE